jgi:hypothetical protein
MIIICVKEKSLMIIILGGCGNDFLISQNRIKPINKYSSI